MRQEEKSAPILEAHRRGWLRTSFAGMGKFSILWAGQVVTLVGTTMSQFAFVLYTWQNGGRATEVVLVGICAFLPKVLLSPIAGALVDRLRRKFVLMASDIGGLLALSGIAVAHFSGVLQIWHIYLAMLVAGTAEAFQYPAFSAVTATMVHKDQFARANGMLATARSVAQVLGPVLGGGLMALSGIGLILVVDMVSFLFAVLTILFIAIPEVRDGKEPGPRRKLTTDTAFGLRYIARIPSIRKLAVLFFMVNFVANIGFAVLHPMVLAKSGNSGAALAAVSAASGAGGIVGGILMSVTGGPRDRIRGLLIGIVSISLLGQLVVALTTAVPLWAAASLFGTAMIPLINSSLQAILQAKVPADAQGRVFGSFIFTAQIAAPFALFGSGVVADRIFEPGLGPSGLLHPLSALFGQGPGSGMATLLGAAGVLGIVSGLVGFLSRDIRDLDTLLPDAVAYQTDRSGEGRTT